MGAPLATALSMDLIAILSLIAGVYIHQRDIRYNARILSERWISPPTVNDRRTNNGNTLSSEYGNEPAPYANINGNDYTHAHDIDHETKIMNKNDETEFYDKHGLRKIAWHPIDKKCLMEYKILIRLGLSGMGQLAAVWWCWEVVGCE